MFVCIFYLAGILLNQPFQAMGFTEFMPVMLALLLATFVVVECETRWIHHFRRSDDTGSEPALREPIRVCFVIPGPPQLTKFTPDPT